MKRYLQYIIAVTFILLLPLYSSAAQAPSAGEVLPETKFAVPQEREARSYLGLSGGDFFEVPQIKSDVVIIEIMSMYCPFCQKEAANLNELYRMIEDNPKISKRIKMIGIGAGNSSYELKVFREKYKVPFPLIPDKDYKIHQAVGEVRTPYFIVASIEKGIARVIYSRLGGFEDVGLFLEEVIRLSGLEDRR